MSLAARLKHELRAVVAATLFFGAWIGSLILLKTLVLEEYRVGFSGWSQAAVGALILGKVVLLLEHVPLGARTGARPAWVDVVLRTLLYSAGVVVVLVIEHGLRGRHEHGGFLAAVAALPGETKFPHLLATTLVLAGALLAYNVLAVIRQRLGPDGLRRLFLSPPPENPEAWPGKGAVAPET